MAVLEKDQISIYEYKAKKVLAKFGVLMPAGFAALAVSEAGIVAIKLPPRIAENHTYIGYSR